MANVLGELFGDIAAAIREKTGDSATMKPNEFPAKISGIEAGGGSEGGATGVKMKLSSVTLSGVYGERVSVNFGFKPGFLLIAPGSNMSVANSKNYLFWGISSSFEELTGTSMSMFSHYIYSNKNTPAYQRSYIDGTDKTGSWIYGADETGFNMGKSAPASGSAYVVAIGI